MGTDYKRHHMTFPRQLYGALYGSPRDLGSTPVGMDFIGGPAGRANQVPPDFDFVGRRYDCAPLQARRWSRRPGVRERAPSV